MGNTAFADPDQGPTLLNVNVEEAAVVFVGAVAPCFTCGRTGASGHSSANGSGGGWVAAVVHHLG